MSPRQEIPKQLRLKKIEVHRLKGITNCKIEFPNDKKVTAIMGMNGSGKSTIIHAIACCYKPKGMSSQENNRFSDFFTPHLENNWHGSKFTVDYYSGTLTNQGGNILFSLSEPPHDNFSQIYTKVKRWMPIYDRRPVKNSIYIGLQALATLSDNASAFKHSKYRVSQFQPAAIKDKILESMSRIMGANYSELMTCTSGSLKSPYYFIKLTKNGVDYTEHTMGAGEKRVYEVLRAAHDPDLHPNGLLLIDELDVLLHEKAFKKLVAELILIAKKSLLEIIFSTHRESVIEFKRDINIVSIFNIGAGIEAYPGVSADALRQLNDIEPNMLSIFVEDELARSVINVLLEREALSDIVNVALFGAAENSAVVLSGLLLSGNDISNTMCILDGDIFLSNDEKLSIIRKYLTGTDKREEWDIILGRIFDFKLKELGVKGSPELNHKNWFERIDQNLIPPTEIAEFSKLRGYSQSIQGLDDWHEYYDELNKYARKQNIEHTIVSYISKYSQEWGDYTHSIKEEIIRITNKLK